MDSSTPHSVTSRLIKERAHRLVYEKAVPIRLQYSDYDGNSKDLGEENLVVRILVQGVETVVNEIRIELRSEQDIYFNLDCMYWLPNIVESMKKHTRSYRTGRSSLFLTNSFKLP